VSLDQALGLQHQQGGFHREADTPYTSGSWRDRGELVSGPDLPGGAGPDLVGDAAQYGRQHGITVIDGGCPLMFGPTADFGHKAMRFVLTRTGTVPKRV
jgi:hypothetical protein